MTFWGIIATCFYLGRLPIAPGSWGSLGALILWFFLPINYLVHSAVIIFFFILGVYASKMLANDLDDHDPSQVVIDEAVGMGISLFMLPHSLALYLLAFFIFRFFDIFKPSFIYHVQNLPGGWGIMLDDVLAGFFTLSLVTGFASL